MKSILTHPNLLMGNSSDQTSHLRTLGSAKLVDIFSLEGQTQGLSRGRLGHNCIKPLSRAAENCRCSTSGCSNWPQHGNMDKSHLKLSSINQNQGHCDGSRPAATGGGRMFNYSRRQRPSSVCLEIGISRSTDFLGPNLHRILQIWPMILEPCVGQHIEDLGDPYTIDIPASKYLIIFVGFDPACTAIRSI